MRPTASLLALSAIFLIQAAAAPAQGGQTTPAPARDPAVMTALDRMGETLRGLTAFTVTGDITDEEVLTSGQKLQSSGQITTSVRRPDRFRIESVSDRKTRTIYYDGKTVTVFAPKMGYYASFPAPPTIIETLKRGEERYGFTVPLADLFSWGTDPSTAAKITSAAAVGSDTINGQSCNHYAMRQPGIDWQIWLPASGPALPCKFVITTTDDPAQPQYSVVLRWDTNPSLTDDTFAFTPPADTKKIVMGEVASSQGSSK